MKQTFEAYLRQQAQKGLDRVEFQVWIGGMGTVFLYVEGDDRQNYKVYRNSIIPDPPEDDEQ